MNLTVFCPFTREWCVEPFFLALGKSDVPRERFVAYIDGTSAELARAVEVQAYSVGFPVVDVHVSGREIAPDSQGPLRRRVGHARMREDSKALVGDGPVLLLEDDTLIPPETYALLSETLESSDWAIGAEVGRWGHARPVGAWHILLSDGRPVRKTSLMPNGREREPIDASGLYCVLTTGEVYRTIEFGTWSDRIGHDVHSTYRLSTAGFRLMVDWRVGCGHLTETGVLTMDEARPYSVAVSGAERGPLQSIYPPKVKAPAPLRYPVYIAVACELGGRRYPAGSCIDRETAMALRAAGQLKDERIV